MNNYWMVIITSTKNMHYFLQSIHQLVLYFIYLKLDLIEQRFSPPAGLHSVCRGAVEQRQLPVCGNILRRHFAAVQSQQLHLCREERVPCR